MSTKAREKAKTERKRKRIAALSQKNLGYFKRLLAKDPLENWSKVVLQGFFKSQGLSGSGLHHTLVARASKVLSPEPGQIPPTPGGYKRGSAAHREAQSQRVLDGKGFGKKNKAQAKEQGGNKLQLALQGFRSIPGGFFTDEGFCGVNATPEEYENALTALIANDAFVGANVTQSSITNFINQLQQNLGFVKIMGGGATVQVGERNVDARKGLLLYHRLIDTSWYENDPCDAEGRPFARLPMCNVSEVEAVSGNVRQEHRDKTQAEEALALAPEGSSLDYQFGTRKWRLVLPNGKLVDAATYQGTIGQKPAAAKRNAVEVGAEPEVESNASTLRERRARDRRARREALLQGSGVGGGGELAREGDVPGGDLEREEPQGDVLRELELQGEVPGGDLVLESNASTLRERRARTQRKLETDARANRLRKRQAKRDLGTALELDVEQQGAGAGGELELDVVQQGAGAGGELELDVVQQLELESNASTLRERRARDRRASREALLQGSGVGGGGELEREEPQGDVLRELEREGNVRTRKTSSKRKSNDISSDDGDLLSGE